MLARSPGLGGARHGATLVLLDPEWQGVRRMREEHKLGLRGSSTVTIELDGVRVGLDHVLGEPGQGLPLFQGALTWGRTFLAAGCLGTAQGAIAQAVEHVRTRRQFGRPLARFGMVRHRIATARAQELATQSALALTTTLQGTGQDIGWESSFCKVLCSETAFGAIDSALQLHGGMGYIEQTGVARRLRDCRVTRIFEGANDVLRVHIAAASLGWDRQAMTAPPALAPRVHASIAPLAARFDEALCQSLSAVARVVKSLGVRLFDRQLDAGRIADLLVDAYSLLAAFAYVQGELVAGQPADPDVARLALLVEQTLPRMRFVVLSFAENADSCVEPVARLDLD